MEADLDNLTPEQREKVNNFMAITMISNLNHAVQFLEMCNYDLQQAINTALETGGNIAPNQARAQPPINTTPPQNDIPPQVVDMNEDYDVYVPRGPLPEFTDEENEFYQYKLMQNEKAGLVKNVTKVVNGVASWLSFKITTGDEFIRHAYKTLAKKTKMLIDFQKINLQSALEDMELNDPNPLLIYVHKNDHKLTPHILKEVIQDEDIAAFINGNFKSMGMLTSNREMKIVMNFIEKEAIPCFLILRKDRIGKICKIAQVELNCEGYLAKDVIFALLQESRETFMQSQTADRTFIQNFERKLSRRRQVMEDRINAPVANVPDNAPPNPGFFAPFGGNNQANEGGGGLTAQELERRRELEREREIRREQERQYEEMKRQQMMEQNRHAEEERLAREEEERIRLEEEEVKKMQEEEQAKRRRKMSEFPEEPEEGAEGTIKIAFRLPNGSRVMRNFNKDEAFELAYDFVYAQDDIGLEDPMAQIEILTSYPPKPLTEVEKTFEELFGGAKQELLIIKEL